MPIPCPPVAGTPYEDVAERTEKLAEAFSEWRAPAAGEMDAGRALIQVFARMAQHVIDRVNRVPERSFAAFLDRVGVTPAPPCAARAPLTFALVERGDAEPVVPAGTRVGAAAASGDTREIVFETEIDLPTTRARLVSVFVRQPDGDRIADCTDKATGQAPGFYEAFDGGTPAEHALYLAADDVLGLPAGTEVTVTFLLAGVDVHWTYWNGKEWADLSPRPAGTGFTFEIPADMAPVAVDGREARWIRARLLEWPGAGVPSIQTIELTASPKRSGLAPEAVLSRGWPVDLSGDFHPFGEQPRLNDTFHIACDEAIAHPRATVTVAIQQSTNARPLSAKDRPVLSWEISTRSGWTPVARTTPSGGDPIPNDALRTTSFTVPDDVARTLVGGREACWLRVRLAGGGYGQGLTYDVDPAGKLTAKDDGCRPPILTGVSLDCAQKVSNATPRCILQSDRTFSEWTRERPLIPFVRASDEQPALYLGFDRPFSPGDTLIYVQVAPLRAKDAAMGVTAWPRVVWEHAAGSETWAPLACQDDTGSFAATGFVRFIAPSDATRRVLLGQARFWIRARLDLPKDAAAEQLGPRRLGRILTNTVWASHAAVVTGEILGSGDGRPGQSFSLSLRPVLAGERVEVREPAPPPTERAEIERLAGSEAITPAGDPERPNEVWVRWHQVPDFYASGPRDRHYVIDCMSGQIRFGDGLRGMPPPRGARNVRAAWYRAGGGVDGNRPVATITQLKTTIPYVEAVTNHEPSQSGADREHLERVKDRGPRVLRHRQRAVTAEDCEDLACEASPLVARARAILPRFDVITLADRPEKPPERQPGVPAPGGVLLLVATSGLELPPTPSVGLLQEIDAYVRARLPPAADLRIVGPSWVEVRVAKITVVTASAEATEALRRRVERALDAFLHPITGGDGARGWGFGQIPRESDIHRLVRSIPGVDHVGALELIMIPEPVPGDSTVLIYPGPHTIHVTALGAA